MHYIMNQEHLLSINYFPKWIYCNASILLPRQSGIGQINWLPPQWTDSRLFNSQIAYSKVPINYNEFNSIDVTFFILPIQSGIDEDINGSATILCILKFDNESRLQIQSRVLLLMRH